MTPPPRSEALAPALASTSPVVRLVDRLSRLRPVTRRSALAAVAVAGSALATDARGYALRPQSAYATICGPENTASGGWSVFCATVNKGINGCPPGSFTAGWWKAADSSWCGGGYRYLVDCNAKCTKCRSGCSDHICDSRCWNCSCGSGPSWQCDRRRECCNAFRYGQCNTQVSCSGGVHCRVASCVPPYRWERCSTTSLSSNATAEHSSPYLPRWGSIEKLYRDMGGHGSFLRASTSAVKRTSDGAANYVNYQGGRIIYTTATGASALTSFLLRKYEELGGAGVYGWPKGATQRGLRDGGWLHEFQNGAICDSASTATTGVWGWRWTMWRGSGREDGPLRYPVRPMEDVRDGWIQVFQKGCIVYSASTRRSIVDNWAWTAWQQVGREEGPLGFPVSDREAIPDGTRQRFENGGIWGRTSRPMYAVRGAVLDQWEAEGGPGGSYGFPTAHVEELADGSLRGEFEGGSITA